MVVSKKEIEEIKNFVINKKPTLKLNLDEFLERLNSYKDTPHFKITGKCPFRTHKCPIYNVRPWNCRKMFCGRRSLEEPLEWSDGGDFCFNAMRRKRYDSAYRKFVDAEYRKHTKRAEKMGFEGIKE